MITGTLVFELLDYWRCGAGHGSGRLLDATVVKTPAGLPMIPGRTIRGLCRDAVARAEAFGHLPEGTTEAMFGSQRPTAGADTQSRFTTNSGAWTCSNATLGADWEAFAASTTHKDVLSRFFDTHASTKLDEHRVAEGGTLRTVEVAVPCTLVCEWECEDDDLDVAQILSACVGTIRSLGVARSRGFGRARVSVGEGEQ